MDDIEVPHGVIVQPDTVLIRRVLGRFRAVRRWLAVKPKLDGVARSHGRIFRNALVDIDAGVVALAPRFERSAGALQGKTAV